MNYYPNNNFYQNYSYGSQYQAPAVQQPIIPTIQGKVVDNPDMVRVTEVPFGGFGVFPKGDLSEIYVKSWSSNGTTQINTYKPIPVEDAETQVVSAQDAILEKITSLEEKLDKLLSAGVAQPISSPEPAKEVKTNAF